MTWEAWQQAVEEDDGANLWDVYVLDTDRSDWQRLLDWLRGAGIPLSFKRGPTSESVPHDVGVTFVQYEDQETCTLFIDPDGMQINTHFFTEDEIELDLGPRDVRNEHDLARLQQFLTSIAGLLGKTVIITTQNGEQYPLFEISPNGVTRSYVE